ncbi:MAG: fold metallo-hydrolase [Nocardia sp.]|uniref:MBL fold metallo-hydrolase n=1 Tax=Nocardia sp. TaxID=1821 RepID=UPI00260288D3|nr:MBL fold metallo-hydrolase [Nocardia sp.]MCU1639874.1 fold metallo-hydrolase [Nocardia sp.]
MNSRIDRRRFFRMAATAGVGATAAGTVGAVTLLRRDDSNRHGPESGAATAELRWLGVSGWRIDIGADTLLIDPYLTRFPVGLATGAFDPATPLRVDPAAIDPHVGAPKHVFVTHTHWDHFNDVPYIATRTGARVHGTLTTYNLATACGVPPGQLSTLKGGEILDFGDYTMEVVGSLHSRTATYGIPFPGVRTGRTDPPATIADLPEGDTLNFQLSLRDGPSIFFMGASDFVERNVRGLNPDVAMIAVNAADVTHDYIGRLLRALNHPATVVPVHWDDFESPLQNPPPIGDRDLQRRDAFVAAVRAASPSSKVIVPEYGTPYRVA